MSKGALKELSDNTFTTNGVRAITAASHRSFNDEAIDAMYLNPGSVIAWAGLKNNIPSGWSLCNGVQLSKTEYADLFTALGGEQSPWGVQTTTFSLPNIPFYGSPVQSNPANELTNGNYRLGLTGGEERHTLNINEMPYHKHGDLRIAGSDEGAGTNGPYVITNNIKYNGINAISGETGYTGSSQSHNNMQPFAAMYWIIKIV